MSGISASAEFLALQEAVAGHYSLERELGRGGMGVVFLARDVALDRLVAIKLLPPDLAGIPEVRTRFLREARTAAGLAHPNIVPIHSVEEVHGLVFFVMGYVDGETLGTRVRREGALPSRDVMRVTQEIAWALGHAHARGIVHRDVKPDNVLLERDTGRALVVDFGIARSVAADTPAGGLRTGTPQYMSPEQITGGVVDARSDLYSLGVTAFFAATGRLPFESHSNEGFITKHLSETPPPLARLAPALPTRFAGAVDRCLAKDPDARCASAEEFGLEVEAARGALVRVPASLQRFAREAHAVGSEAGGYLVGIGGVILGFEAFQLIEGDFLGITRAIEILMVTVFTGLSATRVGRLVAMTRQLLREGYDHRALAAALTLEDRALEAVEEPTRPDWRAIWPTVGVGVVATGLGLAGMATDGDLLVTLGLATTIAAPLITVRRLWEKLGGGKLFSRLLRGRLGRWMFRVGGVGLRAQPALPAAGERTELALGRAVEDLFRGLPDEQRARLGDVPTLVDRLEADALALRAHANTPQGGARLATAVAAIETLRLDLLKLHAGTGSMDELTRDLDAARALGAQVDAQINAQRDANGLDKR
ncbi:MAG: protein kinase [Gemmatimonadota bacterium]|nr:protein kinase [Gemmatimonadota bacterium]MDH4350396.1 protein kinase [Gemmatimonadota bacterium]MDH5198741.1 protein kinase [Gemmatimonadota bacterium]